jgi:NDP-sugar pyrophosphorylase family protein
LQLPRAEPEPAFRAAILAAGEGSRLAAGGIRVPKPLVPVRGMPMIVRLARQLDDAGACGIHALVHPDAWRAEPLLQASGLRVDVRLATTAGSFHSLCALLPRLAGEPFLLSLVDSVFDGAELPGFVGFARARKADVVLGVTSFVEDEAPLRVGVGAEGTVVGIGGPSCAASRYVTGGVYWFADGIEPWAARARERGIERLRHFLSFLVEAGVPVAAHEFSRIVDVDTAHDLQQAEVLSVAR